MSTLKIVIPKNKKQIERQIHALEYQLTQDTRKKDKEIHSKALEDLKVALEQIEL